MIRRANLVKLFIAVRDICVLRLPYLTVKRCDTERLQQSVAALLGVTDVRLNAMARSLSVAYDPGLVVSGELEAAVLHGCEVGMIDLSVGQPPVAPLCLTQTRQTVGYDVLHQTP